MGFFRKTRASKEIPLILRDFKNEVEPETISVSASISTSYSGNGYYADWKDERSAECPNCQGILKKIPGAKTKCPHCDKYMFVRMDSRTKSQRVVTEEEVELIDDERAKIDGNWPERLAEKNRKKELQEELTKKWGEAPSPEDVQWGLWNQDLISHAGQRDWGLYRNTKLQMAQSAEKRKKNKEALLMYMDVMYLDACGPGNSGLGWNVRDRMYLPYIADRIENLCKKESIAEVQLVEEYKGRAEKLQSSLKLPIDFASAWPKFKKENESFKWS